MQVNEHAINRQVHNNTYISGKSPIARMTQMLIPTIDIVLISFQQLVTLKLGLKLH
jgi:hypothetical protein